MSKLKILLAILFFLFIGNAFAGQSDSVKIDYSKMFSYALDADITSALNLYKPIDTLSLSEKDRKIKNIIESRFKYDTDKSNYIDKITPELKPLMKLYSEYWHKALKSDKSNFDSSFSKSLIKFLMANAPVTDKSRNISEEELNNSLIEYCTSLGYNTTGFGRTGKLLDLLVWKSQYDSLYSFVTTDDTINVNVTFMENFVTLGWEEYATLGQYYPGGWANEKGLYCVKSAYDLQSENFLISYLAHEGRHFKDYKLFPNLTGAELEYRAKLTELSLADNTLYKTIEFFINNGIKDSESAHSKANYLVIQDLSKYLFKSDYVSDISKWKSIPVQEINSSSLILLNQNNEFMKEKYIK
jgi:hypothetical protein